MNFVHQRDVHFATLHLLPLKTDEARGPWRRHKRVRLHDLLRYVSHTCRRELDRCQYFNRDIARALNFSAGWNGHASGVGRPAYHGENVHVEHDDDDQEGKIISRERTRM